MRHHGRNRRGIAAIWLVLSIPLFVAVLGFVLNIGFLWIAEIELENAAASGALAGAKVLAVHHHKDHHKGHKKGKKKQHGRKTGRGSVDPEKAIAAAKAFVKSNDVLGKRIRFDGKTKKPGKRIRCHVTILTGTVKGKTFHKSRHRNHKKHNACYVQLTCKVEGPLGWLIGPKIIRASAAAVVRRDGKSRLVEIDKVKDDH